MKIQLDIPLHNRHEVIIHKPSAWQRAWQALVGLFKRQETVVSSRVAQAGLVNSVATATSPGINVDVLTGEETKDLAAMLTGQRGDVSRTTWY